jgi:hypothetical protein
MRVMVTGGVGRPGMDRTLAGAVLDRLHRTVEPIDGIVAGKDPNGNTAAMEWWAHRVFYATFLDVPPDVIVILPGTTSIARLREAIRLAVSIVVVHEDGPCTILEGRRQWGPLFRGIA